MTMITKEVQADIILPTVIASNNKQLFQTLADIVSSRTELSAENLLDQLLKKENDASSGIGEGIAIPHLRVDHLKKPFTVFCRLKNKMNFDTVDHVSVDMVFLLLSPKEDGPLHLRRLSRISRFFKDTAICEKLRNAKDTDAIRSVLLGPQGWLKAA